MTALRLLDLFSGIGGFSYAAEHLVGGFVTTQFVEIDPYCQSVLKKHWPYVPVHDDIRTFRAEPGEFDVLTGRFPCQDISSAGKQAGLSGERSGLFYEVIRLARELRPQFLVLENVANLVSHQNGETFQEVLFQIARAGFDAEWAVVSARDVGACHLRKRVWIVAYATGDARQLQSSEWEGVRNKPPVHGEKGLAASNANHQGPQGQWPERELGACGGEESAPWRCGRGLCSDWRSYLSQPVLRRGDDGLSNRVDRLKALGNAVVPQVAAIPLQRVRDIYEGGCINVVA